MDKSVSPPPTEIIDAACQACDALNDSAAKKCWLCGEPLLSNQVIGKPFSSKLTAGQTTTITLCSMFVVLGMVGVGLMLQSQPLGTAFFVVAIPGFVGALIGAALFQWHGRTASTLGTLVGFLSVACVMIPIATIFLVLAAVAAFLQACGELLSGAAS